MESDPLYLFKKYKLYSWIVGLGFLVYANCLFNGFVWDDLTYIVNNADVKTIGLQLLFKQNWYNLGGFYRPIPAVYFALLYHIAGTLPFFYHITEVGLHIINTILLFSLFKKFFHKQIAYILSLLFLIHPVNTESVAYIASSDGVIFFFFGMIALLLSWKETLSLKRLIVIFSLLLFSLMSKEMGVFFIFLVILQKIFFQKKNRLKVIFFSLGTIVFYMFMRISVIGLHLVKDSVVPIARLSFFDRILQIPAIIWYYTRMFFFPLRFAILQNWIIQKINVPNFFLPIIIEILLLGVLGIFGVSLMRKNKKEFFIFLFFFLWTVFGIGMVSNILPLDSTVADRWFYFPMVGCIGILGSMYQFLGIEKLIHKKVAIVLFITILSLLSLRTILRNSDWVDQLTLNMRDAQVSDDYNKEDIIAIEYIQKQEYALAEVHAKRSIAMNPNFANLNDLAVIYQHEGKYVLAKRYYKQSIAMHPITIASYLNYSDFLVMRDNPAEAVPILKNILIKKYPSIFRFWLLLAIAQYRIGNSKEAENDIQKAFSLSQNIQTIYTLSLIQQHISFTQWDITKLE